MSEIAGVGRHVLDVAHAGIPGWELRFLLPHGPLHDELSAKGLTAGLEFGTQAGVRRSAKAVAQAARAQRADVIHSHLAWADLVAAVPRLGGSIRISTEHGIAGDRATYANGRADGAVTALAHIARMRRTRGIIGVSEATAQAVRDRWRPTQRTDVRVVRNGIDRLDPSAIALGVPGRAVVGYLGRFAPEKRVDLLVRAFAELAGRDQQAMLALAGSGETEPMLRRLVSQLGLTERVRFDGWVNSAQWLGGVDVLCLPSVWENCSYAILEGLARGVGVVAAPVGGNPELLPRGALADPTDGGSFANAIAAQLNDCSKRPGLPNFVPSVPVMTLQIAAAYADWALN